MRAIAFDHHGAAPELHDLPVPQPAAGEVLVRVTGSSVNGFDLGTLGGYLKGVYEHEFPVVLGKDFTGTVAALGQGVDAFAVGDAVFGVVMRPTLGQGAFAEFVAVPAGYGIAPIPQGLDPAVAGALGLAGTAAVDAVGAVAPEAGSTLLVSGATGGVGAFAVQLAAARGAVVIATARPGAEADFVRALGATHVVDHGDLTAAVRAVAPDGVDAALHFAGDGTEVAELLASGGRFVSTVHFAPERTDVKATAIMADPSAATLAGLAAAAADGRLQVRIAKQYALEDAEQAFAAFGAGTLGKIMIKH